MIIIYIDDKNNQCEASVFASKVVTKFSIVNGLDLFK